MICRLSGHPQLSRVSRQVLKSATIGADLSCRTANLSGAGKLRICAYLAAVIDEIGQVRSDDLGVFAKGERTPDIEILILTGG